MSQSYTLKNGASENMPPKNREQEFYSQGGQEFYYEEWSSRKYAPPRMGSRNYSPEMGSKNYASPKMWSRNQALMNGSSRTILPIKYQTPREWGVGIRLPIIGAAEPCFPRNGEVRIKLPKNREHELNGKPELGSPQQRIT